MPLGALSATHTLKHSLGTIDLSFNHITTVDLITHIYNVGWEMLPYTATHVGHKKIHDYFKLFHEWLSSCTTLFRNDTEILTTFQKVYCSYLPFLYFLYCFPV